MQLVGLRRPFGGRYSLASAGPVIIDVLFDILQLQVNR